MLEPNLKDWLHRDLNRLDKILALLKAGKNPATVAELKSAAARAGLKIPVRWNVSEILRRSRGLAIRVPEGWEITAAGERRLKDIGLFKFSPAVTKAADDLRGHLLKIKESTTRAFAEEAIRCFEADLYRSAIVMSWLAAVDVLHREVVANHLATFNAEAKRLDAKWKTATNADDLGRMGEADFLDRIAAISMIGKNTKEELQKALKLRNACGHPNSLKVGGNIVAGHIELLLLNVFNVFQV